MTFNTRTPPPPPRPTKNDSTFQKKFTISNSFLLYYICLFDLLYVVVTSWNCNNRRREAGLGDWLLEAAGMMFYYRPKRGK